MLDADGAYALRKFVDDFWKGVTAEIDILQCHANDFMRTHTRKEFAMRCTNMPPAHRRVIFKIWDGHTAEDAVMHCLRGQTNNKGAYDRVRCLHGAEWKGILQ